MLCNLIGHCRIRECLDLESERDIFSQLLDATWYKLRKVFHPGEDAGESEPGNLRHLKPQDFVGH